jgi:transcriptional antiterminator RfaH
MENTSHWYAIHTHFRQESRADANLKAWNIETFYPEVKQERRNEFSGAITRLTKPFFPRYIFARFDIGPLLQKVWFTRGVRSVVSFGGPPTPIDDEIIEFLRGRADKNGFLKIDDELKPGDKVTLTSGVLAKLQGVFEREMNDSDRVMILLQTINYQGHLIVPRSSIRKAS